MAKPTIDWARDFKRKVTKGTKGKAQIRAAPELLSLLMITGDSNFLKFAMDKFGIRFVMVEWSGSQAKWPDIWCTISPPEITLTKEWARQNYHERRKRLTHECLHLKGEQHGKRGDLLYSPVPEKDTYSKFVYRQIMKGVPR